MQLLSRFSPSAFGWTKDLPDLRDWSVSQLKSEKLKRRLFDEGRVRSDFDFSEEFPPAEDQRDLGASCAFACLGVVEYFERRTNGSSENRSKLFLHQVTSKINTACGSGLNLRSTIKTLARFGAPPEVMWTYSESLFTVEPSDPILFGFAKDFRNIVYLRLDGNQPKETLKLVKKCLSMNIPVMFGFAVPNKMEREQLEIPRLRADMYAQGGQAVIACGFNDKKTKKRPQTGLLIRSSWGTNWGDNGFGWLPYDYVLQGHAADFWIMLRRDWARDIVADF